MHEKEEPIPKFCTRCGTVTAGTVATEEKLSDGVET